MFLQIKNNVINRVIPGAISGQGSAAFVVDTTTDFLTVNDAKQLKILIEAINNEPLKDPIARAMWYHEYATRVKEIDVRWTFIATGLENLIHTDRHNSTKQFVKRIRELSKKIEFNDICESEARDMYDFRSSLAHGMGLNGISQSKIKLYKKMEDILRLTIRKSILDKDFKAFLSDKDRIKKEWPVK